MARKFNVYERIDYAKRILRPVTEGMSAREIQGCVCHVWYYKCGRRPKISDQERLVYDVLLKNNLNPKTVYEWFLMENIPEHIKKKLKDGKISLKEASAMSKSWRTMVSTKAGREIKDAMRKVIGDLRWQGQENSI